MRTWSWPIILAVLVDGVVSLAGIIYGLMLIFGYAANPGAWMASLVLYFGLIVVVPAALLLLFTVCLACHQGWARIGLLAVWFLGVGVVSLLTGGGWRGTVIMGVCIVAVILTHAGLFMQASRPFFQRQAKPAVVVAPIRKSGRR